MTYKLHLTMWLISKSLVDEIHGNNLDEVQENGSLLEPLSLPKISTLHHHHSGPDYCPKRYATWDTFKVICPLGKKKKLPFREPLLTQWNSQASPASPRAMPGTVLGPLAHSLNNCHNNPVEVDVTILQTRRPRHKELLSVS